jgi:hypothetical protein
LAKDSVKCEYLSENGLCKAMMKNKEGEAVRNESCMNEVKNSCCYMCPEQDMCEIGCDYLSTENKQESGRINQATRINREIAKYKRSIEKLSVFFAEGKISEESYLRSIKRLEGRIDRLEEFKKRPESHDLQQYPPHLDRYEDDLVEKPSSAWFLVPFLFGIIGGIIGYIATQDRDEDLAMGLLIFGLIWTFVLGFVYLMWFFSLLPH